jgi:Galactose oxidase, central domain/Carbohydrate-binding module family 5/12/Kelch motif
LTQESYRIINLFNWAGGVVGRRRNPLRLTEGALAAGENVDVSDGALRTRPGTSLMSSGSLPSGEVMALANVRFPTNEATYLVAQVKHELNWIQGSESPDPQKEHTAVWDAGNGRMLVFGGHDRNDLLAYDPDTDAWTVLSPNGTLPCGRSCHSAIYDPKQEVMVVFGGRFGTYGSYTYLNDLWLYDCVEDEWKEISPTGTPPSARANHVAVLRTSDHTMIILQGDSADSHQIHVLDLDSNAWSVWTPSFSPDPVGGRFPFRRTAGAYDPINDQIIIVGGQWADDVNSFSCYSLNLASRTWTQNADVPHDQPDDPTGISGAAVYCSGRVHICGDYGGTIVGGPLTGWSYDISGDTWSQFVFKGEVQPVRRTGHSACLSETGSLLVFGGLEDDLRVWCTTELCAPSLNYGYGLYACSDHLPTAAGVFTKIYEFGPLCGVCKFATLNDRVVITEGLSDPPLVWGGCMAEDASDWMTPKVVLIAQDGKTFYDISNAVCDKDIDTVARVGGIRTWGAIYICTDMPKVEGFHFEMESPNTGAAGTTASTFHAPMQITGISDVSRQDLKTTIVNWHQDSGTTGHFTDASGTRVTIGAGNDRETWDSGAAYVIGDTVSYDGARYWCILGNTNQMPTNSAYWLPNVPDLVPGIVVEVAD